MEVELSQLTAVGIPLQGSVRINAGDEAPDGARFPEPLEVDGRARRVGDLVVVAARVLGKAVLQCGRCLASVEQPLDIDFEAKFAPQSAAPKPHGTARDAGRTTHHEDAVVEGKTNALHSARP